MYNKGIKLKTIHKLHHDFIYVRTICAKLIRRKAKRWHIKSKYALKKVREQTEFGDHIVPSKVISF